MTDLTDASGPVALPAPLMALLDGRALADKVGTTIQLTAVAEDGWPRQALLSVGEVVAVGTDRLRLALYANSRTTRAMATAGRALLTVVVDEVLYKAAVTVTRRAADTSPLAQFDATVVAVDADRVPYARLRHGIEYELLDPVPVLTRWQAQVRQLTDGT